MRAYLAPCILVSILALTDPGIRASEKKEVPNPTRAINFASLPLSFEPCAGSGDLSYTFCHRAPGYAVFLTPTDVSFTAVSDSFETHRREGEAQSAMEIRFVRANHDAHPQPSDQLPGTSNYLIGRDPKRWRRGVVQYARVIYRNVYRGIDVFMFRRFSNDFQTSTEIALTVE